MLFYRSNHDFPIVALPGVDDLYPPQKKSFLMFKFLNDHFGDKYKFFMRADDDVFVNVEKLNQFLENLNSSEPIFLGQTGVGNDEEFGQLNLKYKENFCMGGPGVLMSFKTLSMFASNIHNCLKNLYSTHEDVEIGRCVRKYSGVSCTWSYDMQKLFHHNVSIQNLWKDGFYPTKELFKTITIHPIKDSVAMQNLYLYFKNIRHQELRHEISKTHRDLRKYLANITSIDKYSQYKFINQIKSLAASMMHSSTSYNSLNSWKFFSKKFYSESSINPKKHIAKHIVQAYNHNLQSIMSFVNRKSVKKGRILDYHSLYYGYIRFDSNFGVQYILDLLLIYRKYQGKRMTIPVRRHAYAVQSFSETIIRERENVNDLYVNIIVPLAGRISTFKRFISNFISVLREDSFITLTVVLFPEIDHFSEINETKQIMNDLKSNYLVKINVLELNGTFSRANALQKSSSLFADASLLLFIDVDMHFSKNVLYRVRHNTILSKQMYFPIVFSQYGDQLEFSNLNNQSAKDDNFEINNLQGYWRQFGYGMVSLYKRDLDLVGGYNISINGWGMEDVDLYDRVVQSNLTIFRAIDPELIHVYHKIRCEQNLSTVQYEMCLGTKLSSLGSIEMMAQYANTRNLLST